VSAYRDFGSPGSGRWRLVDAAGCSAEWESHVSYSPGTWATAAQGGKRRVSASRARVESRVRESRDSRLLGDGGAGAGD